jgi:hypothetical protein
LNRRGDHVFRPRTWFGIEEIVGCLKCQARIPATIWQHALAALVR